MFPLPNSIIELQTALKIDTLRSLWFKRGITNHVETERHRADIRVGLCQSHLAAQLKNQSPESEYEAVKSEE